MSCSHCILLVRRDIIKNIILKRIIPITILVALAGLIIASFYTANTNEEGEVIIESETKAKKQNISTNKIKVDIKGEVVTAGVYELKTGSRVADLIEKAGGLTENANTELINLSKKLKDENVVIIYSKKQVETIKANSKQNIASKEIYDCPGVNDACVKEEDVIADTTKKDTKTSASSKNAKENTSAETKTGTININTSSIEELETLNGIGQTRAEAIIEYREKNGNFNAKEDIKKVQGIGDALYDKIKDNITV